MIVDTGVTRDEVKQMSEQLLSKLDEKVKSLQTNFKLSSEEKAEKIKQTEGKMKTADFFRGLVSEDRHKVAAYSAERAKALNEATGADGGHLVPEEFETEIIRYQNKFNILRPQMTVLTMRSDTMRLNSLVGEPTVEIKEELAAIETGSQPTFGEPVLTALNYMGYSTMSTEVLEDAETDLNSLLGERFARQIAKVEEQQFVTATASGREGLREVTGVTVVTASSTSEPDWDDLANLQAAIYDVAEEDADEGAFYMSMQTYNSLRTLKATGDGNYFLPAVPSVQNPPSAWGKPIIICNRFTTATAGEKSVMFTNLRRHAYVGDRRGIRVKLFDSGEMGGVNLNETDAFGLRVTKRTAFTTALQSGIGWVVLAT